MPMPLTLTVDDPDGVLNAGQYGAGALMRLQWSATQAGVYADVSGTGSTPTINIVSGQSSYPGYDPAGTTSLWYRTRFENVGATRLSDWFPSFQPGGGTTYASLAMFRSFIRNQQAASTDEDGALELLALEAAARAIDRECGRRFGVMSTATARVYTAGLYTGPVGWPFYGRRYAVDVDDFSDPSPTVAFDSNGNGSYTIATTAFRAMPANAPAYDGRPYTALLFDLGVLPPFNANGIQVTAKWGWIETPSAVVYANLLQASRFLKRRDSPYGVAGSPDMGNEIRLLAKLDPDVALSLRSYRAEWGNQ
jgi:hypothetical protein